MVFSPGPIFAVADSLRGKAAWRGIKGRGLWAVFFSNTMKSSHSLFVLRTALALYLAAMAVRAFAWDPAGHMLVDQIAWNHLKPAARERVSELVKTLETTYNEGQDYNFVTAGAWMDDMRAKKGYAWAKLHYMDSPWTADASKFAVSEPPHVLGAIGDSLKTLRDPAAKPEEATLALAMLTHFVGDVHQPLHCTDRNNDRGGNGVLIAGVVFSDLRPKTVANLHTYWDKAFRFDAADGRIAEVWLAPALPERPKVAGEGVIGAEAAKIEAQFPREKAAAALAKTAPEDWAKESYVLGCTVVYPANSDAADHAVVPLTVEYAARARSVANERVALAGYRLADVLNGIFAK